MAGKAGRLVKIYVDVNDDPSNRGWTLIGQQRDGSMSRGSTNADSTHKDDDGAESHEVTRTNWGFELTAVLLPNDPALDFLETKWAAKEHLWAEKREEYTDGRVYTGQASIEDWPDEFPDGDLHTFSLSLKGTGILQKTTYSP